MAHKFDFVRALPESATSTHPLRSSASSSSSSLLVASSSAAARNVGESSGSAIAPPLIATAVFSPVTANFGEARGVPIPTLLPDNTTGGSTTATLSPRTVPILAKYIVPLSYEQVVTDGLPGQYLSLPPELKPRGIQGTATLSFAYDLSTLHVTVNLAAGVTGLRVSDATLHLGSAGHTGPMFAYIYQYRGDRPNGERTTNMQLELRNTNLVQTGATLTTVAAVYAACIKQAVYVQVSGSISKKTERIAFPNGLLRGQLFPCFLVPDSSDDVGTNQ